MHKKIFLLIISIIIFSSQNIYSQSIKGKIIDEANSDPLAGAIIKIVETKQGAAADQDGVYTIDEIKPGSYTIEISYIGYTSQKINDVKVLSGKVTDLNIALKVDGVSTDEITVEASQTLANEQSLLTEQKNSSKIQDGISEQQIKRAPDATAGDVLKRIIGVNIIDNKFVYIRGTSERYNNTTLNGVLIPSSEADRKSFSFDLFPSKLLENIIIAKSFSPELPGNFSGGLVQLNTKDLVDQLTVNFETSGTFLTGTTSKGNFYDYNAGEKKTLFWLNGLDNGSRAIPSDFPSTKFSGPNTFGKSLNNNWQQNENKAPLNSGFLITLGNNFSIFQNPLGVLFAYTYKNGFVNETIQRSEYNSDTTTLVSFSGRTSNYYVLSGGLLNLNYKVGDNNKFSFKNTTSISSDDNTRYYEGFSKVTADLDKKIYVTDFIERRLYSGQLSGNHYLHNLSKLNFNWYLSYSESERNEPDTKSTFYQREIGTEDPYFTPLSTIANANVGERFYSTLFDINRNLGLNFDMNFLNFSNKQRSKIKFGALGVGTDRNFSARNFAPVNAGSFMIGFEPIDSIYRPENMDSTKLYYIETTDLSDQYTASENLYATYLMFDVPLNKLKIIAGLRYEYDEIKLDSYVRNTQTPVNVNQTNNDLLPSVNAIYALNSKTNLRASFSQTVSRPELREIAPFAYIDFVTQGLLSGNPNLEESLIQNYDLRYELFPDAGEIASLSLFYKHF
ncbi:MAG: TonB-dependent receptor, partial [Ignavibacteria bacterium]|nr:TonB-dependent receptor [Ignavibacteria bacterium]